MFIGFHIYIVDVVLWAIEFKANPNHNDFSDQSQTGINGAVT